MRLLRWMGAVAVALAALAPSSAEAAPCGPTYCPSYGTELHACPWKSGIRCRVDPVVKDNPTFAELSDLFDKIAVGPSKYGALGWGYSLDATVGVAAPKKVPVHFPCVLLKAISALESVGWNQFCQPTGPVCTGKQQTIVACDCGYGLMQVTSGMNMGETSAYDPNRVASDAAYNASVGSQILGAKWNYGPAVGDRQLDVIEDWYFATWAYNGFAFSNNPNNPAYPADRKPYRDPGGLSGGNYPYQEKIWGYVRVPYGLKEKAGVAGYKAYPISFPDRSKICASCGKPTANIPEPSPTHFSDCPGSGGPPPPAPGPRYELSTEVDADDRFNDGTSKAIADLLEGDTHTVDLVIKNTGDKSSPNVSLGVSVPDPWVVASGFTIESDATGKFAVNDADARPDQPSRTAPGKRFTFQLNAFAVGETKRVRLKVKAAQYSIGTPDHPDVREWVQKVEGVYEKAEWDTAPTNPSGQTWNGGDLRASERLDVFSKIHWSFDGGTFEGWVAGGAATAKLDAKALVVDTTGDDPQIVGPETEFDAATYPVLHLRVKGGSAGARVYFSTKDAPGFDEARSVSFDLPGAAEAREFGVDLRSNPAWKGTITRLRIDPLPSGTSTVTFEDLRMTGPEGLVPIDVQASAEGSCGCETPGRPIASGVSLGALGLAMSLVVRRRRR